MNTIFIEWGKLVSTLIQAVDKYIKTTIGNTGYAILNEEWRSSVNDIVSCKKRVKDLNASIKEWKSVSEYMAFSSELEDIFEITIKTFDTITSKKVLAEVNSGMSGTYSKNLESEIDNFRIILVRRIEAHVSEQVLPEIKQIIKDKNLERDINTIQNFAFKGTISSEFYLNTLINKYFGDEGFDINISYAVLETIKDRAFGIPPDTTESLEERSKYLCENYNPIQIMTYFPQPKVLNDLVPKYVDISIRLPKSEYSVIYDINRIVDKSTALLYGPISYVDDPISDTAIERLKTIKITPITSELPFIKPTKFIVQKNEVFTVGFSDEYMYSYSTQRSNWAPLAGSKQRVDKYNEIAQDIILQELKLDDVVHIKDKFRESARKPLEIKLYSPAIITELLKEFEIIYDKTPPENTHDFKSLIIPDKITADCYIFIAIERLASKIFTDLESKIIAQSDTPISIVKRELAFKKLVNAYASTKEIRTKIAKHYREDKSAFYENSSTKKNELLRLFKFIVSASIKTEIIICIIDIKLFSLLKNHIQS